MSIRQYFAFALLSATIAITACSSSTVPPHLSAAELQSHLLDEAFLGESPLPVPESPPLLALSDEIRTELDRLILPITDDHERFVRLRQWIFDRFRHYEFDVSETYSIAELATSRKINCLSFSAIFVAAARHVGIDAQFQLVDAPPYWDAASDTWINNQHINVTGIVAGRKPKPENQELRLVIESRFAQGFSELIPSGRRYRYVVDISPAIVSMPLRRRVLNETQVQALFYSNKMAESLLKSDLTMAYAWNREALLTDPDSAVAWNNLGVLYSKRDLLPAAAAAFQQAILLDDGSHSAHSNLAGVYRRLGKPGQAEAVEAAIADTQQQNPYYHQRLAHQALARNDLAAAITHLQAAVERKHNEFLFYHELAIVHQQLGHREAVMDNLVLARRHARGSERSRFSGKLQALRELASH